MGCGWPACVSGRTPSGYGRGRGDGLDLRGDLALRAEVVRLGRRPHALRRRGPARRPARRDGARQPDLGLPVPQLHRAAGRGRPPGDRARPSRVRALGQAATTPSSIACRGTPRGSMRCSSRSTCGARRSCRRTGAARSGCTGRRSIPSGSTACSSSTRSRTASGPRAPARQGQDPAAAAVAPVPHAGVGEVLVKGLDAFKRGFLFGQGVDAPRAADADGQARLPRRSIKAGPSAPRSSSSRARSRSTARARWSR